MLMLNKKRAAIGLALVHEKQSRAEVQLTSTMAAPVLPPGIFLVTAYDGNQRQVTSTSALSTGCIPQERRGTCMSRREKEAAACVDYAVGGGKRGTCVYGREKEAAVGVGKLAEVGGERETS